MLQERSVEDIVILAVPSYVSADEIQGRVAELLGNGQKQIALDLTLLTFVESSGLGTLVNAFKQIQGAGGQFAMFSVQPYVQKLVDITKLGRILAIYESEGEAVSSLKASV